MSSVLTTARRAAIVGAALLLCLGAVRPADQPATADDEAEAVARARDAVRRLTTALVGRLTEALADGETADALRVCADVAQDVTARVRDETGVEVRRTSLRLRNPANAPDPAERAWLEARATGTATATEAEWDVVSGDDGARELRYLQPIGTQALCLRCHGAVDRLDPATRAALAERYPEDRATGYREGELRGLIVVQVPLAPE